MKDPNGYGGGQPKHYADNNSSSANSAGGSSYVRGNYGGAEGGRGASSTPSSSANSTPFHSLSSYRSVESYYKDQGREPPATTTTTTREVTERVVTLQPSAGQFGGSGKTAAINTGSNQAKIEVARQMQCPHNCCTCNCFNKEHS